MNINKYTEKAQEAILAAQQLADREGNPEILPEHLLLTLVEQREGIVPEIVRKMNADPAALAAAVRAELDKLPRAHGGSQPGLSARLRKVTDCGRAGSRAAEGRVRQHRAPLRRDRVGRIAVAVRRACSSSAASRKDAHSPGDDGGPRVAARDQPESRRARISRSSATAAT